MKRKFAAILVFVLMCFVGCTNCCKKAIELMGAGDRIHDTFTFANVGVKLEEIENNVYKISGSVEKLESEDVKNEFDIDEDIEHVVVVKLSALGKEIDKNNLRITVNGVRAYDAEHLNGTDYTFIILEAVVGGSVSIEAKWNTDTKINYIIQFDENLQLK